MSTRAIIGIQNSDGSITGGWQWNDGKGLLPLLKKYFPTEDKIERLITSGVWNNIAAPEDVHKLELFFEFSKRKNSNYHLIQVEDCQLLKEKPCDNAEFCFGEDEGITVNTDGSMTFENFKTANGQDISYLYLFSKETKTWKVYS